MTPAGSHVYSQLTRYGPRPQRGRTIELINGFAGCLKTHRRAEIFQVGNHSHVRPRWVRLLH